MNKKYLQALLAKVRLFAAGAQPFRSRCPSAFYALLLARPAIAADSWSATECKKELARRTGDAVEGKAMSSVPPPKRQRFLRQPETAEDEFGGDVVAADHLPDQPVKPVPE